MRDRLARRCERAVPAIRRRSRRPAATCNGRSAAAPPSSAARLQAAERRGRRSAAKRQAAAAGCRPRRRNSHCRRVRNRRGPSSATSVMQASADKADAVQGSVRGRRPARGVVDTAAPARHARAARTDALGRATGRAIEPRRRVGGRRSVSRRTTASTVSSAIERRQAAAGRSSRASSTRRGMAVVR